MELHCTSCDARFPFESGIYGCPICSGIIEVRYRSTSASKRSAEAFCPPPFSSQTRSPTDLRGVWRYFDLLPVEKEESIVSLCEGETPLVRLGSFGDGVKLYAKDETRNPTGSFKDRPNTVGISRAIELGAKNVAVASSGNAAGSLAAYAAKAKIECIVAVPEDTPDSKLKQIAVFGAKVVKVRGSYSDAFSLVRESCKKFGWHNLSSVSTANPYQVEGDKTVAYEIWEQFQRKAVPDWVAIPLGAGPLLVGIWKGFKELYDAGLTLGKKPPRLIGVQAEGCSPIVGAFKNNEESVSSWEGSPHTVAHSIADPLVGYSQDGTWTLKKIRESGGVAESVSDSEMVESSRILARREGIFSEPAAASSVAVVTKLKNLGVVKDGDSVVSIVTGTGLKSLEAFNALVEDIPVVGSDPDELVELI